MFKKIWQILNSNLVLLLLGFILLFLCVVIAIFIKISMKIRRGGGGMTQALLGSTYELHNKDRQKAIETIVEHKAGKKMEEQESSDADN